MVNFTGYFQLTSYSCQHTLDSFYRKKSRIKAYVVNIEDDLERLGSQTLQPNEDLIIRNRLLENFTFFCECVYSCMDYIGYLLYIYQKRTGMLVGSLKGTDSSFHDMINCYHDGNKRGKYSIFRNKRFCSVINDIGLWYYPLRSIRSKEAHYNTGSIISKKDKLLYDNHVVYGEHIANSFDLSQLALYYSSFSTDSEKLIMLMTNYEIK